MREIRARAGAKGGTNAEVCSRSGLAVLHGFMVHMAGSGLCSGSWRVGVFADWHLTQLAYLVMYVVVIAIQGGYLWLKPSTSARSSS